MGLLMFRFVRNGEDFIILYFKVYYRMKMKRRILFMLLVFWTLGLFAQSDSLFVSGYKKNIIK